MTIKLDWSFDGWKEKIIWYNTATETWASGNIRLFYQEINQSSLSLLEWWIPSPPHTHTLNSSLQWLGCVFRPQESKKSPSLSTHAYQAQDMVEIVPYPPEYFFFPSFLFGLLAVCLFGCSLIFITWVITAFFKNLEPRYPWFSSQRLVLLKWAQLAFWVYFVLFPRDQYIIESWPRLVLFLLTNWSWSYYQYLLGLLIIIDPFD